MQVVPFSIFKFSLLISCCLIYNGTLAQKTLALTSGQLSGQCTRDKDKTLKSGPNGFLAKFSAEHGEEIKTELFYKVQIGAYQFPESFNYKSVAGMPKLIRELGKDHLTRFSMGNFTSYNDAHELLIVVHANGLKDAFVVAIYKGERKTLEGLIEEKILQ